MDQPHVEIYVACSFDMNTNVMPLSRHKHRADAGFTGGQFAPHCRFFVLQGAVFAL
jgi:hypothetical protein